MGLLDDAIREHLELKRLRGADPGEVAREQREALDPVPRRGEEQPHEDDLLVDDHAASRDAQSVSEDVQGASGYAQSASEEVPGARPDSGDVGSAAFSREPHPSTDGEDPASEEPASEEPRGAPAARDADFSNVGQETAELDMRTVLDETHGAPGAGGTSDAGGVAGSGQAVGEPPAEGAEDVLEETPDFLRDTPEQERLWFEQRPPRDFDFDK